MQTVEEMIAAFERQIQEEEPTIQALLAMLNDCDPRERFAIPAGALPEITPRPAHALRPRRPLPPQAIRA